MRWILVIIPLLLAACGSGADAGMADGGGGDAGESPDARVAVDERAFVDAALSDIFSEALRNDGTIVISEKIGKPLMDCASPASMKSARYREPAFAGAFDDLLARLWMPGTVARFGELKTKHVTMTAEEDHAIFHGTDLDASWQRFYEAYPFADGFVTLSWPGFTPDGTRGVIYVEHSCGSVCGHSQYYAFELKDGVWTSYELSFTCAVLS